MSVIHGFRLVKKEMIGELRTLAELYMHEKTGAQLLSLQNEDENKVFGIAFRTPPSDSTGLPHILEHSVLCGSRKYPVKEPFVELLKGSLQTFLNAFTYPDKTCYPVASQNVRDFYNLVDVYLDAVFHPRLTPDVFRQEGWHYELEAPSGEMKFKGVVFNEMKGAYASPDNLLAEYSLHSLFPDTPYRFDSGGDPRQIPSLTFERFEAFHKTYYHPSNARIFFHGDDDPQERLRLVDGYLREFDAAMIDSSIPSQPPFPAPVREERFYMVGEGEDDQKKGMVTVNWVLGETAAGEMNFALQVLDHILLGTAGSPLRKALIESGLGEDIASEGLGDELRQMYFSAGLKGVLPENLEKVEPLVLRTLEDLARRGIDPRTVEASLNTVEFRLRENNTGHFPRGLLLMLRALTTWLYDRDPLLLLAFDAPLKVVKERAHRDPGYFQELVGRFFLDNTHRSTLLLRPDPELRKKWEASEKKALERARSRMGPADIDRLVAETLHLKRRQETPDPPEALATIPTLRLEDLERENKIIPLEHLDIADARVLYHDLFTNGITYMDLGLDLHALDRSLLPYVPLLGRAFTEMGTEEEDFVSLAQRIGQLTGGIGSQTFTSQVKGGRSSAAWLFLRGKALAGRQEGLFEIFRDVLLKVQLDNRERFRQMVLEEKARCEQRIVPSGHQMVNLRLRSHFGEGHGAAEQMEGINYYFFILDLARRVEEDWPGVLARLRETRRRLVNRNAMVFNITLDEAGMKGLEPRLAAFVEALPRSPLPESRWTFDQPPPHEGMIIPSQVNYVGKGADVYALGYRFHGSSLVITRYLRNAWLWDKVRVQGGAYGAFCLLDRYSGVLTFVSYRDPNLDDTLKAFDGAAHFLRQAGIPEKERVKSIIGAVGDLDTHLLPDAKGYTSMLRYLAGETDEARQRLREEVLGTRERHFREFAEVVEGVAERGLVKVMGSPAALQEAARRRPGWLEVFRVL